MYDFAILNGTIADPKTQQLAVGNLGIKDGVIRTITREKISADEVIDATDKIVSPGFVDIHSHVNFPLEPAWMSVRQGITTALSGNCGLNVETPIKDYLDKLEKQGYPLNFATLIGHSWRLRELVGLTDPYDTADAAQVAKMVVLAEEGLEQGAFGVSLGLEYSPGANEAEYLPLVQAAANYGKLVPIHIRTDALDFAIGLNEAITMMKKTGARVHISHLAYQFGVHPEVTEMAMIMVRNTIAQGWPLLCDSGVYEAFATYIQSAVFDEGWNTRYGVKLSDLMISSGKYTGQRATPEIYEYVRTQEEATVGTAFVGVWPDLVRAIKEPFTMISTDAGLVDAPGEGHPQDSGTYPKVFEKLVREQGALTILEAVTKSTYMPAKQMGIADTKGFIGLGADADIVVFDPQTIKSNSDYVGIGRPDAPPTGIDYVIVNGVTVVRESKSVPDQLPGKIMRQANKPWTL
ncbi:MAG: amidohydrolase family protein [Clostridiales Family XIII bacterium]|jgi:N-acyl-D-amino-acid deacylase|nr:amidohydrolase family protein [Clostridiales Family XIII bacterium]